MKILQIFGAVVAVHLLAFIFIFASPGCQSGPRNVPTPDATMPAGPTVAPVTFSPASPTAVDLGTGPSPATTYAPPMDFGHAAPTRPGSPAAAAVIPPKATANVAPVSAYTIVKGDNLWNLAKKNNLTVSELAKANNLSTGATLQPGKKLIIPGKVGAPPKDLATVVAAPGKPAAARVNSDAPLYEVLPGESLGVIARKLQTTTGELAAANNITDPSKVRAGQKLMVPGFKAVSSKAATSAPPPAPATPAEKPATPHFELTPPPPGQDLDAGLKETSTEVPTIKVEPPAAEQPPKN